MSGDIGGGRVVIPVEADASGVREQIKRQLDRDLADLKAQIAVTADTEGLRERIRAAIDEAQADAKLAVRVHLDTAGVREELDEATRSREARLRLILDPADIARIEAQVDALKARIATATKLTTVGDDTAEHGGPARPTATKQSVPGGIPDPLAQLRAPAQQRNQQVRDAVRLSATLDSSDQPKLEASIRGLIEKAQAGDRISLRVGVKDGDLAAVRGVVDKLKAEAEAKKVSLNVGLGVKPGEKTPDKPLPVRLTAMVDTAVIPDLEARLRAIVSRVQGSAKSIALHVGVQPSDATAVIGQVTSLGKKLAAALQLDHVASGLTAAVRKLRPTKEPDPAGTISASRLTGIGGARSKVSDLINRTSAGETVDLTLKIKNGDREKVKLEVERLRLEAQARGITLNIKTEVKNDGADALKKVESVLGAIAGKAVLAGGAALIGAGGLNVLAGGAVALAAAIVPAIGAIAAAPAALLGLGAVAGAVGLAFHGISAALQAYTQQQATAGATAAQLASQRIADAQAVAGAEQAVTDAVRTGAEQRADAAHAVTEAQYNLGQVSQSVAQQTITDTRAVAEAQYNLGNAVQSETDAERSLNEARLTAIRTLEDLKNAQTDAALSAQSAQLSLETARQQLAQTMANPNATRLEQEQALLGVQQAQQSLAEATQKSTRAVQDNQTAQKKGVEGQDSVISASEAYASSVHGVQQAVLALADAQRTQSQDAVTGQHQLADATYQLATAQRSQRDAQITSAEALRSAEQGLSNALRQQALNAQQAGAAAAAAMKAFNALSPAGQDFVRYLASLTGPNGPIRKLSNDLQTALLPSLEASLKSLVSNYTPILDRALTQTGHVIAGIVTQATTLATSPAFKADFATVLASNNAALQTAGTGVVSLLDAGRQLAVTAGPLINQLAAGFAHFAHDLDAMLTRSRANGGLATFFADVGRSIGIVTHLLSDVGKITFQILKDAFPAGASLGDALNKTLDKALAFLQSPGGSAKVQKFFADIVPPVKALGTAVADLLKGLGGIGTSGQLAPLFASIGTLAKAVGPFVAVAGPIFVTILTGFAKALALIASIPGVPQILGAIAGTLLAISVVNKFTHITDFLSFLGKRGQTNDIEKLSKQLKEFAAANDIAAASGSGSGSGIGGQGLKAGEKAAGKDALKAAEGNAVGTVEADAAKTVEADAIGAAKSGAGRGIFAKLLGGLGSLLLSVLPLDPTIVTRAVGKIPGIGTGAQRLPVVGRFFGKPKPGAGAGSAASDAGSAAAGDAGAAAGDAGVVAAGDVAGAAAGADAAAAAGGAAAVGGEVAAAGVGAEVGGALSGGAAAGAVGGPLGVAVGVGIAAAGIGAVELYKHQTGFHNFVDSIGREAKRLPGQIASGVSKVPGLIKQGFQAFGGIADTVGNGVKKIPGALSRLPGDLAHGLGFVGGYTAGQFKNAWDGASNLTSQGISSVVSFAKAAPGRVADGLKSLGSTLGNVATNGWTSFHNGITNAAKKTDQFFTSLPGRIGNFVSGIPGDLKKAGNAVMTGFHDGLQDVKSIGQFFQGLPGEIVGFCGDAGSWLTGVAQNVIDGFANGLSDAWHAAQGFVSGLWHDIAGGAKDGMNAATKSKSPSRLMAETGRNVVTGIIAGVQETTPELLTAFDVLHRTSASALTSQLGAMRPAAALNLRPWNQTDSAAAGGGVVIAGPVTINNPRQERASESINARLRRMQVLGTPAVRSYVVPAGQTA